MGPHLSSYAQMIVSTRESEFTQYGNTTDNDVDSVSRGMKLVGIAVLSYCCPFTLLALVLGVWTYRTIKSR